ncbi:hypothetical protein [Galbibacter mesophilus]|uniref:hypothetical protein n=1 Tax=Galbibacter mesophilus TaxID=379069 RepID=UPI00191E9AEA|nr:hypothetical protein [Galbibacter mesophilus]MCM5664146.1 hypothetical protein [Galbibacter mesophilus]
MKQFSLQITISLLSVIKIHNFVYKAVNAKVKPTFSLSIESFLRIEEAFGATNGFQEVSIYVLVTILLGFAIFI